MQTAALSKTHYRLIVMLSLVIGLASAFIDLVFPELIPAPLRLAQEELDAAMSDVHLAALLLIGGPGLLMVLIATYGLYQFRAWAPKLGLIGTGLMLLVTPALGAMAQSGLCITMSYVASYLWGAALVLCFVAPYREWFVAAGAVSSLQDNSAK